MAFVPYSFIYLSPFYPCAESNYVTHHHRHLVNCSSLLLWIGTAVLLRRSGYSGHSDSFFVVAGFFICGMSLPLQEKRQELRTGQVEREAAF